MNAAQTPTPQKDTITDELDGIIADLRAGYPDLVDLGEHESYPASIRARVERVRQHIAAREE